MFINTLQPILNVGGKPYQRPSDGDNPHSELIDLTLGWVIVEAILMTGETKLEPTQHLDRYLLAQRFLDATMPVGVSNTEAELIRKQIALRWGGSIQIAGQAVQMINRSPDKWSPPVEVAA